MIPYGEVADYARDSIQENLLDGDSRGKTGWEEKPIGHHLLHAYNHLVDFEVGERDEDHLKNAQTRIAMARILLKKQSSDETNKRLPDDEFIAGELDK